MHVTKIKKSVAGCLLVIISVLLLAVSVLGAEQELKMLEFVRTYHSEKEYQRTNAKMLRAKKPIVDDGESIKFFDPETGQILKQIKKENTRDDMKLADAERTQLANMKSVKKTFQEYYIPERGSQYLHVREYEMTLEPGGEGDVEQQLIKSTLYNDRGEKIADLPLDSRFIYLSLDKSNFVMIGKSLYFYSIKMELLQKRENNPAVSEAKYSSNGQYIAMYDILVGKYFRIFTKGGELIFEGNYKDYTEKNVNLYGVFVSDDGNYILLSTSKKAILLNSNGKKLWEVAYPSGSPHTYITSAFFNIDKGVLYMSSIVPDHLYENRNRAPDYLIAATLKEGKVVDEITHIVYYTMTNNVLYLKKRGGGYYEYNVK